MLAQDHPVSLVCDVLACPRSSYYYRAARGNETVLCTAVTTLAAEWPTYGYRRLTALLQREGWAVNHKHVRRLMGDLGLRTKVKRKRKRTTDSRHPFPRYPNLVEGLRIERPDQVWVADITYVRLGQGFVYLAVLMDVFTRSIRGWNLSRSLDERLTLTALEEALQRHPAPAIHHSDQGVQYAAAAYTASLQRRQVQISMAEVGEPTQNGYAERLMRTIKEEEVDLSEYRDYAEARSLIGRFLDDVYMHKRIHSSLGYLTPAEFAAQWAQSQACSDPA
jgi:transposase InsO family protein